MTKKFYLDRSPIGEVTRKRLRQLVSVLIVLSWAGLFFFSVYVFFRENRDVGLMWGLYSIIYLSVIVVLLVLQAKYGRKFVSVDDEKLIVKAGYYLKEVTIPLDKVKTIKYEAQEFIVASEIGETRFKGRLENYLDIRKALEQQASKHSFVIK